MRKVTEQSARALRNGENYSNSNTKVKDGVLSLHNNAIAHIYTTEDGTKYLGLSDCGWQSNTTKERLNGIIDEFGLNVYISQKNFEWFLNTYELEPVTSEWGTHMARKVTKVEPWNGGKSFEI